MGIRERLNENPRTTIAVVVAGVLLAVAVIVMQVLASRRSFPSKAPDAYFSMDDGKTYFTASSDSVPPFDYKGGQAVRAYVFECSGKRFVGYLERYTPQAHQVMRAEKERLAKLEPGTPSPPNPAVIGAEMSGRELKRPGDAAWVRSNNSAAAARIIDVRCQDGSGKPAEPVAP